MTEEITSLIAYTEKHFDEMPIGPRLSTLNIIRKGLPYLTLEWHRRYKELLLRNLPKENGAA